MVEVIVACVIVGGVLILAARSLYGTFTGKDKGGGCGSCPYLHGPCSESRDGRTNR